MGFDNGFYYLYPSGATYSELFITGNNSACTVPGKLTPYDPRCRSWYTDTAASTADSIISPPYLSLNPQVMESSVCSKVQQNNQSLLGVSCADTNLKASQFIASDLPLSADIYYFIVDTHGDVVWHSLRQFVINQYSITETEFYPVWPPEIDGPVHEINTTESRAFNATILPLLNSTTLSIGTFFVNGSQQIFAQAPINLIFSFGGGQTLSFQLFICMKVSSFTQSATQIQIIQGKTLLWLIIFAITTFLVVFVTFG